MYVKCEILTYANMKIIVFRDVKMEAARASKMSVKIYQTTPRHI
jgi:hypothetical protein